MFGFLFLLSDIELFFVLTIFITVISLIFISLLRNRLASETRSKNNTVIGNVANLISIIYGVFVGLMALYLLNNINFTTEAVLREANSLADIYRDSKWLKDPPRSRIQLQIKDYLTRLIDLEWPSMKRGERISRNGATLIENITNELINYHITTSSESLLVHDMLDDIKILYDAREQRIQMSYSELNTEIWIVILIGTFLIIFINYLYYINFYLHIVMISVVALMTSSMMFLLITLDRPFQGEFVIEPRQFMGLLESMKADSSVPLRTN